jgi:hypothetical protein
MSYSINYTITLSTYASKGEIINNTISGQLGGFKTKSSAKAYLTRWVVNTHNHDGRSDDYIEVFEEA